jgi:hypothetical protein
VIARAVIAASVLAAAAPSLEKVVLGDMPITRATAATAYFRDCAGRDDKGRTLCHACFTHMHADADGKVDVWSDNNEYTIENGKVLIEDPRGGIHATHVAAADGARERGKGAASFEKFLAAQFEDGTKWCAGFGGTRHDLKNVIAAAARGHYVVVP